MADAIALIPLHSLKHVVAEEAKIVGADLPEGYPGVYDSLVFNRFWAPESCWGRTDAGCLSINASSFAATNL